MNEMIIGLLATIVVDILTKWRSSAVTQKLLRQLTDTSATLQGAVQDLRSMVSSLDSRVGKLEENHVIVTLAPGSTLESGSGN